MGIAIKNTQDKGHMDYNAQDNKSSTSWEQRINRNNTEATYRYNPGRVAYLATLETTGLPKFNPERYLKYGEERFYLTDANTGRVEKVQGIIDHRIPEEIPTIKSRIIKKRLTPEEDIFIFKDGSTHAIPRKTQSIPKQRVVETSVQKIPTQQNDNTSTSGSKYPGNIRQGYYPNYYEPIKAPDGYNPSNDWIEERDQINGQVRVTWRNKNTGEIRRINPYKNGGTMNRIKYFEKGGLTPQNTKDIQQQVIALVQAAMQGDEKANQTVTQIMEAAKAGDQQAVQLAQMIQQVVQQIQGQATTAKWGAKLDYIRSLKYAQGGKACQACEKGVPTKVEEKACGGKAKKARKRYFGGWL